MSTTDTGTGGGTGTDWGPDRDEPLGEHDEAAAAMAAEAGAVFGQDPRFEQPALPDLAENEVRLPWLEADDEYEDAPTGGMGQGLFLAVLGLIAIGLIVGGLIWATHRKPDQQMVADGGVIAAPKEPYKTRPENPGGEVVAGTGDTSFAVAEGQSRQVHIDGQDKQADAPAPAPAPAPSAAASAKPVAAPASASASTGPAAPAGGIGVQVGAYSSKAAAEAGWTALKSQYPGLSALSHRVLQGQADIGTVYRLQAVPGDAAAARSLCSGMKAAGLSCQVKN